MGTVVGALDGALLPETEGATEGGAVENATEGGAGPSVSGAFFGRAGALPPSFLSLAARSRAALMPAALRSSMLMVRLGASGRGCGGAAFEVA